MTLSETSHDYAPRAEALLERVRDVTRGELRDQVLAAHPEQDAETLIKAKIGTNTDKGSLERPGLRTVSLDFDEATGLIEESILMDGKRGVEDKACVPLNDDWDEGGADSWAGKHPRDLLDECTNGGDPASLEAIDQMADEVGFHLDIDTESARVDNHLVGGTVNTTRYMQNVPTCMRRRTPDTNNQGLIRIICDGSSSANVDDASLEARSCAVVSLVSVLNQFRPVEFWLASAGEPSWDYDKCPWYENDETGESHGASDRWHHDTMTMVRVSTHPIDISLVSAAMSQAFIRRFMYGVEYLMAGRRGPRYSGHLGWPDTPFGVLAKQAKTDIVVPPVHCSNEEMMTDAVKWVAEHARQALSAGGEAYSHHGSGDANDWL